MADPLSIIGAVAAITQISSTVLSLIKNVKNAPNERRRLLLEINATTGLCQALKDYTEIEPESSMHTLRVLSQNNLSPLEEFEKSLTYLQTKLTPGSKTHNKQSTLAQTLKWPFAKNELLEIIASIERQKSLFGIALTNDSARLLKTILDETQSVTVKLDGVRVTQEEQARDARGIVGSLDALHVHQQADTLDSQNRVALERKQTLLAKLTTIDFHATHADISSRRAQNTGQWLLNCPEYILWHSKRSSSVMWCPGIPGSGKTILASLIIDTLQNTAVMWDSHGAKKMRNGVSGVYCSYQNPHDTTTILRSLLQQLLMPMSGDLESYKEASKCTDVLPFLVKVSMEYQDISIIIDALDESTDSVELLRALRQLLASVNFESSETWLRILITGRHNVAADIERELKPGERREIFSREADVRNYLHQTLCSEGKIADWIEDSREFEDFIINKIISKINGMFLLARLYKIYWPAYLLNVVYAKLLTDCLKILVILMRKLGAELLLKVRSRKSSGKRFSPGSYTVSDL